MTGIDYLLAMNRKKSGPHPWANHPELLTSIRSPWQKFRKADWNFDRYEDAIMARPCDTETVVYTALDFCIAIVALRDWTRKALARDIRQNGKAMPAGMTALDDFTSFVAARVQWQSAIEAIANTVKHADYRDTGWEKGTAMVASFVPEPLQADKDACRDGFELFGFMHKHRNVAWWDIALRQIPSAEAEPGYIAFGDTLDEWRSILDDLGYITD
ncbi:MULTISPECIES: hypothetical protein [unclassified Sphingomonas]|uniref:hypothetical protein n=1 Tax=unclassified Sphingomonas TaxID=196159 RepID=UPI0012E13B8D|nr:MULTISPECIES: hypothetical protein [unclassified Sphingomonas]